jgi:hypothetical protein
VSPESNNGTIDVSGIDGSPIPELECGTGGGGAGTIFVWAKTVKGDGFFKALGGKGGGKGTVEVEHPGGNGADGSVRIFYETEFTVNAEKIKCHPAGKISEKVEKKDFWTQAMYYIPIKYAGKTKLAEYKAEPENGTLKHDEVVIIEELRGIAPADDLNAAMKVKVGCEIEKMKSPQGTDVDCAQVEKRADGKYYLCSKDFLACTLTAARVDFDKSVFVAKVTVIVYFEAKQNVIDRREYLVLAGKWPTEAEWKREGGITPSGIPPALGFCAGLRHAGREEWTIVTEQRFKDAGLELKFANFCCYAWAVGVTTELPRFGGELANANTYYGQERFGLLLPPEDGFRWDAKVLLMSRERYGVMHAYAPVGFQYFTGKMGSESDDPVILHTKEQIDPSPGVENSDRNVYGSTEHSYKPKPK